MLGRSPSPTARASMQDSSSVDVSMPEPSQGAAQASQGVAQATQGVALIAGEGADESIGSPAKPRTRDGAAARREADQKAKDILGGLASDGMITLAHLTTVLKLWFFPQH